MDEVATPEMLEEIGLLQALDLLEREPEWEIFLAIDNTPPKPAPPPKKKAPPGP